MFKDSINYRLFQEAVMFQGNQQIGPYILIKQLGKGGFGEVWHARRTDASSPSVAIKFPKNDDVNWQAIVQEIGLWVLCGKHPNVLPLIEARNYNGQIAIISEYAPDGSLRDLLNRQGGLPHEQAVKMIIGVLDGLVHLHSSGIIHRDIKPENILLQRNTPRLADFGISRVMTLNSSSQTVSGTYWYMAPEAFDGKRNVRTDIWSVGVILYEMLKGSLPFPQSERTALIGAILTKEPEPLPASVPENLKQVTQKALAKDPAKRYQTAAELRAAFHSSLQAPTLKLDSQTPKSISEEQANQLRKAKEDVHRYAQELERKEAEDRLYREREEAQRKAEARLKRHQENDARGVKRKFAREQNYAERHPEKEHTKSVPLQSSQPKQASPFRDKFQEVFGETSRLIPYRKGDKWGFCDDRRQTVIELKYDEVSPFSEGLARVFVKTFDFVGRYGFINSKGEEVIPLQLKYLNVFSFREGLARVRGGKDGFIDKNGREVILPKWDEVNDFHEGLAKVYVNKDYKGGFIDKAGKAVIPLKYDSAGDFHYGLALVGGATKNFIDKTGKVVLPRSGYCRGGYYAAREFSEGLAAINSSDEFYNNKKWGFIDTTGREVIKPRYEKASSFGDGVALVRTKSRWPLRGRWQLIDHSGNVVDNLNLESYDEWENYVPAFSEGLLTVKRDGKYGFIDKSGSLVIPCKYYYASDFENGLAYVRLEESSLLSAKKCYIARDGTEYFED